MAKDVCECLDIGNSRDAVAALDEDEKGVDSIDTPGGALEMLRDAGVAVEVIDN